MTPEEQAKELCLQCGHLWNDHLIKTTADPPTHGWMECPVEGCKCYFTWSLDEPKPKPVSSPAFYDPDSVKPG